ncbi:MAG: periplasmic heavy metal sensor [Hyphomicrobiaceae bacterium]|nr:periplasmic heavy metal sensor [Hyphomicrobiaceae bacterium]
MKRILNWPRGLAAGLLASVCLNVVFAGYIITSQIERLRLPAVVAGPQRLMELVALRLPREDAEVLWRVYRQRAPEIRAAQASYQASLTGAAKVLEQPSPDVEALRKAVLEARDRRVAVGDLAIGVLIEALPQLSMAGRQGLVGSLRRP